MIFRFNSIWLVTFWSDAYSTLIALIFPNSCPSLFTFFSDIHIVMNWLEHNVQYLFNFFPHKTDSSHVPPQVLRVLITILDTSSDPRTLAVACYDLSQFVQYHPAGRIIVNDLKAKERVMKLMNHENGEVTKNALLCIQRLFLGAKYASFLQV